MRKFILSRLNLCLCLFSALVLNGAYASQVGLGIGDVKYVKLQSSAERINVSKSGIAELFLPEPLTLSVKGVKAGVTSLQVEYSDGTFERITVMVTPQAGDSAEVIQKYLEQALDTVQGIQYSIANNGKTRQVVMSGIVDQRNASIVKQAAQLFGDSVVNQVTFADRSVEEVAEYLKKSLQDKQLNFEINQSKIIITGEVDQSEKAFYDRLIAPYSKEVISQVSFYQTAAEKAAHKPLPTVQIDVEIVEVTRSDIEDIGIQWFPGGNPIELSAGTSGTVTSQSVFNVGNMLYSSQINVTGLRLQLQALMNKGKARILATPRLKVSSGNQATFLAGGEVPIVSTTNSTSSVEYKKFGTQLDITPKIFDNQYVEVQVEATLSTLDFGQAVSGNPTILTKKAQTKLTVRDGQSFALAGLVERQQAKNRSGLPILGSLPVLGYLFSSSSDNVRETETLIIMTPRIIVDDGKPQTHVDTQDYPGAHETRAFMGMRHMGMNAAGMDPCFDNAAPVPSQTDLQKGVEQARQLDADLDTSSTLRRGKVTRN